MLGGKAKSLGGGLKDADGAVERPDGHQHGRGGGDGDALDRVLQAAEKGGGNRSA